MVQTNIPESLNQENSGSHNNRGSDRKLIINPKFKQCLKII